MFLDQPMAKLGSANKIKCSVVKSFNKVKFAVWQSRVKYRVNPEKDKQKHKLETLPHYKVVVWLRGEIFLL